MNKKLTKLSVALGTLAVAAVSCQDYDLGFDAKEVAYKENFENIFGKIDPNQDWSMATQVTVNASGIPDGILEIYSTDPMSKNALLLAKAKVVDGTASVKIDAVKSATKVYARLKKSNSYYPIKGYYDIVDGAIQIGASTRAELPEPSVGNSRVIVGEKYSYTSSMLDWTKTFSWGDYSAQGLEHWIEGMYLQENGQPVIWNSNYYKNQTIENFYPLYNVLDPADPRPEWPAKYLAHYFVEVDEEAPVFAEFEDHISYMIPGHTPQFQKNVIYTLSEDGPITLDYFHKGTSFNNVFGYFYWSGNRIPTRQEFLTMNKYILVDNMSMEEANVTTTAQNVAQKWYLLQQSSDEGSTFGRWDNGGVYSGDLDKSIVKGTRLQLTYFGKDGNSTPTYKFEEGTKIGFFFIGHGQSRDKVLTSIAQLNYDLYCDVPRAATFKYKNDLILALEDQSDGGDGDINDAMFIANGPIEETEIIPDIEETPEPEYQAWTVACEDLGGYFDYDFNDLVFALRKIQQEDDFDKADVELIPLAAGGTLHAEVLYDSQSKGEIHALVLNDESAPTNSPINVSAGKIARRGNTIVLANGIDWDTDINDIKSNISIKVIRTVGDDETSTTFITGYSKDGTKTPQMLLLTPGWDWPSEGTPVKDIYPGFASWATNANVTTWCDSKADNAASYVINPLPKVIPHSSGSGSGNNNPTTPGIEPTMDCDIAATQTSVDFIQGGTLNISDYFTSSSNGRITYSSSKTEWVTVNSQTGAISSTWKGEVTITASQEAGTNGYMAGEATITLKAYIYPTITCQYNNANITAPIELDANASAAFYVQIAGASGAISCTVSNETDVNVTVSKNGSDYSWLINAGANAGNATIHVTIAKDEENFYASKTVDIDVVVKESEPENDSYEEYGNVINQGDMVAGWARPFSTSSFSEISDDTQVQIAVICENGYNGDCLLRLHNELNADFTYDADHVLNVTKVSNKVYTGTFAASRLKAFSYIFLCNGYGDAQLRYKTVTE